VQGHGRVLRGGGWFSHARLVRSASRSGDGPGFRNDDIGFRCAQVQGLAEPGRAEPAAAEPTEEDRVAAEPQAGPTNGGAAAALKIEAAQLAQTPIPAASIVVVRSDVDSLELRKLVKPDWASAIGRDRYGLWAEFVVPAADTDQPEPKAGLLGGIRRLFRSKSARAEPHRPVVQRMRWIPPGRFQMGSPEGDDMAITWEKPQHEVTLSHGYWLFDTPVTQQLWLAVMNKNPSHFQGGLRPVEQVSWDACQTFLTKLNETIAGLNLSLPTEAQWEYACRAGTITRYAFGDAISPD
jgi:formylglycine-generating enzyme required for sulfatase activity